MSTKNQPDLSQRFRMLLYDEKVRQIIGWLHEQSVKLKNEAREDYEWGNLGAGYHKHTIAFGLSLIAEWMDEVLQEKDAPHGADESRRDN